MIVACSSAGGIACLCPSRRAPRTAALAIGLARIFAEILAHHEAIVRAAVLVSRAVAISLRLTLGRAL